MKRTSTSWRVLESTPSTQWPAVSTCLRRYSFVNYSICNSFKDCLWRFGKGKPQNPLEYMYLSVSRLPPQKILGPDTARLACRYISGKIGGINYWNIMTVVIINIKFVLYVNFAKKFKQTIVLFSIFPPVLLDPDPNWIRIQHQIHHSEPQP